MSKILLLLCVFIIAFAVFNLLPIITVWSERGYVMKCTLNAISCIDTWLDNSFPHILTSPLWYLFILPLLLPGLITHLVYRFTKKQMNPTS